jgi:hypothetical protein
MIPLNIEVSNYQLLTKLNNRKMESTNISRRKFVKGLAGTAAGIVTFGSSLGMSAISYSRIIGANERINVGVGGFIENETIRQC